MGTRVFAYEGLIGTISDSATVTGQTSSATGIAIHVTTTQVLIKNISGKFQSGETITAPSGSLTLLDSGSPAIAVAKIDGTWTSTDTSRVDLDGWTTSETNYIKIYTTPEARHNGTWSNDKYRLSVNSQYRGGLNLYAANVKIDGLQIENSADAHDHLAMGIREFYAPSAPQTCTREISNCIIRYSGTTTPDNSTTNSAILLDSSSNTISTCKIWNNMLYGFGNGIRVGYCTTGSTYYLYNNTIVNCDAAGDSVRVYGQWAPDKIYLYMKNNLVQGTTTNYRISLYPTALYEHSSNISSDNSSPDGDSYRNKPVTFLDPSNHDYHIADYDTSVKNKGVDLSLDPNLPFTADIDGQTRPFGATWDVGADEGYYIPTEYVCTIKETGSDFKTLSSWNEAIKCDLVHSTGTRVFSHGGITGTIPNGATVTGESSGATGKATHATSAQVLIKNISGRFTKNEKVYYQDTNSNYIILSDYGSPAIAIAKIDGTWNVADSTATISGWQTSPNNYVKIYTTPEARHPGKWDETKYRLSAQKNYTCVMAISVPHVYVDGLQIENTGGNPSANREMLRDYYTNAPLSGEFEGQTFYREISNNYIRYAGSTTANRVTGMEFNTSFATGTYKAWNNIIEGCGTGIQASYCTSGSTYCIYNNTVKAKEEWCYGMYFNAKWSYTQKYMFLYLKNNLIQGSTNCYYVGSINGLYKETWNNISGDSTSPDNDYRNKPVYFMDISNGDYHLSEADTLAIGTGLNLTSDSWLGFNTDIDGGLRHATGAWDIGADQYNSARGMMKVGRNRAGPDPTFRLGDVFSFPNPAKGGINPTIHAEVGIADSVELKIYNIAAELVHSANISDTLQIINNKYAYEYTWQANGVASGVYIYYIDARKQGEKNIRVVKKLAVIR
ncbi:MAG: hypothetical protein A2297_00335 [Elusimicrobia bacterium RIFOXYB2_FULL_48_7]|nr:MAG: hypothetical protein A2297_00335 [Elusimicrobia bacterium RIFOXYB2_FULL_48_7]